MFLHQAKLRRVIRFRGVAPWLRGFNPWVCVDVAGSELPTLEGSMSCSAAAGGVCSARRARSCVSALLGKRLPPREGLHARLGFGGRGFSCRCFPCAEQSGQQCCSGGWEGLALTQALPRSRTRPFRRSCSPWHGGHGLAYLLLGPGGGKAAQETWERELPGYPSAVPSHGGV